MTTTKEVARRTISALIDRFSEHYDSYKKADYNETRTRRDFIDPFFKALGWDVDNEASHAESYREVIHEDKVKIDKKTKHPDYSFRLSGSKRLFFLEAKKPQVFIKDNTEASYQLRRYGWTAKLGISLVFDFEELAIYDCTVKPDEKDNASTARLRYLTFKDYLAEFDFLWNTFSKESVLNGSFDKFVKSDTHKRGSATVDKAFLQSLDDWRKALAVSISKLNHDLDEDGINFAVQQTLDRLIFLRIAEDRGVEEYELLKGVAEKDNCYQALYGIFQVADEKYNSGLFDFTKDNITKSLVIDNKTLKEIIDDLYYPKSPYEFSVLSVEILGAAYEQFLGKKILVSKNHKVDIDYKPEVRKAGGVYYTPEYIVRYIVENTLGIWLKDKTPTSIANLAIIDPACGSGSFLIGAFQYLLDWHLDYYMQAQKSGATLVKKNGKKTSVKTDNPLTPDGNLSIKIKKDLLTRHIFGVDIDENAVEVTKLSLLLKCMESETDASINHQRLLFNDRVLPNIDNNIRCGNSLIEDDFSWQEEGLDFGDNESKQKIIDKNIKPLKWERKFAAVFKKGGFDVVIGNPPYLRMQGLQETQPWAIPYYKSNYSAASCGNYDLYVLFDEKGYKLLHPKGRMGFIQPHKFFQADFGEGIRNFLAKEKAVTEVVHFGANQVFEGATTYTCLLFLQRHNKQRKARIARVTDLSLFAEQGKVAETFTANHPAINTKWNFVSSVKQSLFDKLSQQPQMLGDITRKIFQGIATSADKIYILETRKEKSKTVVVYSQSLEAEVEIEKKLLKPFLMGKEVKRYQPLAPKSYVIFPYTINDGKAKLMTKEHIQQKFPLGWDYLMKNKKALEVREGGRFKKSWWQFSRPQNMGEFEAVKICTPEIAIKPQMTLDTEGVCYHTTKVYSFVFTDTAEDEKYFLGLLNSSLLWYFLSSTGYVLRGGYFTFKTEYLKPFPIKRVNLKKAKEKAVHDEIVQCVDELLKINRSRSPTTLETPRQDEARQDKISRYEDRINTLVYSLYGLTKEEIKIVEER